MSGVNLKYSDCDIKEILDLLARIVAGLEKSTSGQNFLGEFKLTDGQELTYANCQKLNKTQIFYRLSREFQE